MNHLPGERLVDTNVPITANLAVKPADIPKELADCVPNCVEIIEHVVNNGGLVMDEGNEIFDEYLANLTLSWQPGVGDRFMKWVHDHRWNPDKVTQVRIVKNGNFYNEFPNHVGLRNFDLSDRKFVAVANAHPEKPPIMQATDSKWWGWKDDLKKVGIIVRFICRDYVRAKYSKKIGS